MATQIVSKVALVVAWAALAVIVVISISFAAVTDQIAATFESIPAKHLLSMVALVGVGAGALCVHSWAGRRTLAQFLAQLMRTFVFGGIAGVFAPISLAKFRIAYAPEVQVSAEFSNVGLIGLGVLAVAGFFVLVLAYILYRMDKESMNGIEV